MLAGLIAYAVHQPNKIPPLTSLLHGEGPAAQRRISQTPEERWVAFQSHS
jgi:hypothetical protein